MTHGVTTTGGASHCGPAPVRWLLAGLLALVCPAAAGQGVISTVAGDGQPRLAGDGGRAADASLNAPAGLVVDSSGNLYISDSGNACIRRVAADGTITTIAGNGRAGFSGDGGPATAAQLAFPTGLAIDPAGNLYVADTDNQRIRMIAPDGTITTVAGTGDQGYSGDGGPATAAELISPFSVVVDAAGNLYIADFGNSVVRKVTPNGIISTVAGVGQPGYSGDGGPASEAALMAPYGLAVTAKGDLLVADFGAHAIRAISPAGTITTVAGTGAPGFAGDGGPAARAQLNEPAGLAVTSDGRVVVADSGNNRVRVIQLDGTIVTVAGSGAEDPFSPDGTSGVAANLGAPSTVAAVPGLVLFTDDTHNRVRSVPLSRVVLYGDVNGDGAVTVADALLALRAAVGLATLTDAQRAAADVAPPSGLGKPAGDGRVDVLDAVRILRRAIGLDMTQWP